MQNAGDKGAKTGPFDAYPERYDRWFDRHRAAYLSELLALRTFLPMDGYGIEIGVGTGRFAAPLGVSLGLDPSEAMLERAAARGIRTVVGVAEALPFPEQSFDYVLVVTTICFVRSPERMLEEAHRVLRPGGRLVIGFIDSLSRIGKEYLRRQPESAFYRDAVLYSTAEVAGMLRQGRFRARAWGQTLFHPLDEVREIEPVRPGTGDGAFVVVRAVRSGEKRVQLPGAAWPEVSTHSVHM